MNAILAAYKIDFLNPLLITLNPKTLNPDPDPNSVSRLLSAHVQFLITLGDS